MPEHAPRNTSNDGLLTQGRQLDAEKAQIAGLLEACAYRAMTWSHEPAYGVCWRAVMLHLLRTKFTTLESVRSARRHFEHLLGHTRDLVRLVTTSGHCAGFIP